MYQQQKSGWIKHWDFAIMDIITLEIVFFASYMLRYALSLWELNMWGTLSDGVNGSIYNEMSVMLVVFSVIATVMIKPYSGILRRNFLQEFFAAFSFVSVVIGCALVFLFILQSSETVSRTVVVFAWALGVIVVFIVRSVRKKLVIRDFEQTAKKRAMVLLVGQENAAHVLKELTSSRVSAFAIQALFFFEETPDPALVGACEFPMVYGREAAIDFLSKNVVDELFVRLPNGEKIPEDFMNVCRSAGIAVHVGLARRSEVFGTQSLEMVGNYYVLTNSIRVITPLQAATKRLMDICGALIGLFCAGVISLFVGPFIYIASPGPIFFSQTRIGRNGRSFKFYKFRSMYLDAEARKAELMAQNKMSGLMFKMDDDPRIIKGVGHFIRKTSLDEFPQFWNVLRGDMSLVGTRPPTQGEYEQYELTQKSRLAFKPGITGLWQISGRSDIVDFDEVVRLDMQYIETWTILEDIRILVKTVLSVLGQKGSG